MSFKKIWIFIIIVVILSCSFYLYKANSSAEEKDEWSVTTHIEDKDFNVNRRLPYNEISSYAAYENNVYMSVDDKSSSGMSNKVVQYDRTTKELTTLFTTKFKEPSVQGVRTNADWLTWVDSDDFGEQTNIYIMNKSTKKIEMITDANKKFIKNEFPVLSKNHISWIYHDSKKKQSYVNTYNLITHENKTIHKLNIHSLENSQLSAKEGKLFFIDWKNSRAYIYVFDIDKQKLDVFKSPYNKIGGLRALNDYQLTFFAFFTEDFSDNKLIFYDTKMKKTKEFSDKYMGVDSLATDNNQVFVHTEANNYFQRYKITENGIQKMRKVTEDNIFDMSVENGLYLMRIEDIEFKKKLLKKRLVITSKLQ